MPAPTPALRNGVIAGLPTRAELERFRAAYERD